MAELLFKQRCQEIHHICISLNVVPEGPIKIDYGSALIQLLAWRWNGGRPFLTNGVAVHWCIRDEISVSVRIQPDLIQCNLDIRLKFYRYECVHYHGIYHRNTLQWRHNERDGILNHDDVIEWKPFVRGIHRSPVNPLHKGQWRGALMFSLICVWINGWVNNREASDLRRDRTDYDVMIPVFHRREDYLPLTLLNRTSQLGALR